MAQPSVTITSWNNTDRTITVSINAARYEFFILPDRYHRAVVIVGQSVDSGFNNQAIAVLTANSYRVEREVVNHVKAYAASPIRAGELVTMSKQLPEPSDYSRTPSTEYPFTLIAPTAKNGIVYQGQRYWHKTVEAAMDYAKFIYDANPTEKFDLTVVKAYHNIRPKPQIELQTESFFKAE